MAERDTLFRAFPLGRIQTARFIYGEVMVNCMYLKDSDSGSFIRSSLLKVLSVHLCFRKKIHLPTEFLSWLNVEFHASGFIFTLPSFDLDLVYIPLTIIV